VPAADTEDYCSFLALEAFVLTRVAQQMKPNSEHLLKALKEFRQQQSSVIKQNVTRKATKKPRGKKIADAKEEAGVLPRFAY
jgi:hypothetical protein